MKDKIQNAWWWACDEHPHITTALIFLSIVGFIWLAVVTNGLSFILTLSTVLVVGVYWFIYGVVTDWK